MRAVESDKVRNEVSFDNSYILCSQCSSYHSQTQQPRSSTFASYATNCAEYNRPTRLEFGSNGKEGLLSLIGYSEVTQPLVSDVAAP